MNKIVRKKLNATYSNLRNLESLSRKYKTELDTDVVSLDIELHPHMTAQ